MSPLMSDVTGVAIFLKTTRNDHGIRCCDDNARSAGSPYFNARRPGPRNGGALDRDDVTMSRALSEYQLRCFDVSLGPVRPRLSSPKKRTKVCR